MTADAYLREVEFALRDLAWGHRQEIIADLRSHLAEPPPEADIASRLGSPQRYAADLRAAAGLERRRGVIAFLQARRPLYLVLTVLAATVAGLAIAAVVWIDSYQPIVYGFGTQLPLDSTSSRGQAGVAVVFRKGRPFLYGVTIANNGPFTVRILGVPTYHVTDFFKARLLTNKPNPSNNQRPLEPFRPFDLHPGDIRWLVWKGVYACTTGAAKNLAMTDTEIPIRYSFLWRTATAEVPLREPLQITFSKGGCPSPVNP